MLESWKALLEAQAEATIDGFLVEADGDALSDTSRFLDLWNVSAERVRNGPDSALDPVHEALAAPDPFREAVTDLAAVFETGYSTPAPGTGFGLSIVKRVVEAHGWTVAVGESEDGGARFEFTEVERSDGHARPQ